MSLNGNSLDQECFYDNEKSSSNNPVPDGDESPEFIDGFACGTSGSVPSYMITALMNKPDTLHGLSDRSWPIESYIRPPEPDMYQSLMVVLADRKACEEGWMLLLAVNHKGEVLPFRTRERASWTTQLLLDFIDGQHLDENTRNPEHDTEYYLHKGDDWADASVP